MKNISTKRYLGRAASSLAALGLVTVALTGCAASPKQTQTTPTAPPSTTNAARDFAVGMATTCGMMSSIETLVSQARTGKEHGYYTQEQYLALSSTIAPQIHILEAQENYAFAEQVKEIDKSIPVNDRGASDKTFTVDDKQFSFAMEKLIATCHDAGVPVQIQDTGPVGP